MWSLPLQHKRAERLFAHLFSACPTRDRQCVSSAGDAYLLTCKAARRSSFDALDAQQKVKEVNETREEEETE
jgi:hypothetical protein